MKFITGQQFVFSEQFDHLQALRYAAAAGEYFTQRHINSEYAKKMGYPDIVLDGFLTMGIVSKAVVRVIEEPHLLKELHLKYVVPIYVTDTITITIEVAQVKNCTSVFKLDVTNQNGDKVFDEGYAVIQKK